MLFNNRRIDTISAMRNRAESNLRAKNKAVALFHEHDADKIVYNALRGNSRLEVDLHPPPELEPEPEPIPESVPASSDDISAAQISSALPHKDFGKRNISSDTQYLGAVNLFPRLPGVTNKLLTSLSINTGFKSIFGGSIPLPLDNIFDIAWLIAST